jgi:hypothetical protein
VVNAGPVKICEIFLDPASIQAKTYPLSDVKRLTEAMSQFVRTCGYSVALNRNIMEEKHAKFTAMIEKAYQTMKQTLSNYIHKAEEALEDMDAR